MVLGPKMCMNMSRFVYMFLPKDFPCFWPNLGRDTYVSAYGNLELHIYLLVVHVDRGIFHYKRVRRIRSTCKRYALTCGSYALIWPKYYFSILCLSADHKHACVHDYSRELHVCDDFKFGLRQNLYILSWVFFRIL